MTCINPGSGDLGGIVSSSGIMPMIRGLRLLAFGCADMRCQPSANKVAISAPSRSSEIWPK